MSIIIRENLNTTGMRLPIFTGGSTAVGVNVSGSWTGRLSFFGAVDGINFIPVSVTPFASGTAVLFTTANGNWFLPIQNFLAFQVVATSVLSGNPAVTIAVAQDATWQDAFLVPTSIFIAQGSGANATNTVTVASQVNRAWRLRSLVVSVSGTATWASSPALTVSDGGSSTIFAVDPPVTSGTFEVPLPSDNGTQGTPGKGVVGTVGNSMVITLAAAGGSLKTNINAEMRAA